MCSSKARGSCTATLRLLAANHSIQFRSARWLGVLLPVVLVCGSRAQDTGNANTEFYGKGTAVTVVVHDASGNPIGAGAIVKLFRGGTMPAGQAQTEHGRAELVVTELGDFSVVVAAAGYASVQKDFTIGAAGRTEVDVYLRTLS